MTNNLELLHEGFKNEVEELESMLQNSEEFVLKKKAGYVTKTLGNIVSNLEGLCDSLYTEFEEDTSYEFEELKQQNAIMLELLREHLPESEKSYIRIKHNIDVEGWA